MVGDVEVKDGRVTYLKRAYRILTGPDVHASDLNVLLPILENLNERRPTKEEVVTTIESQSPRLSALGDLLVPTNPGEFWTMFAALIALVALIRNWNRKPKELPPEAIDTLIGNKRNTVTKTGRNEPCPCGSGQKFKYCHGRS